MTNRIGVIMGSISDLKVMQAALDFLNEIEVGYEVEIVSAHRTPEKMMQYAESAKSKGLKVIVAAAGGAAHLPGMIAASTPLPVIGVPIKSSNSIDGWDSVLSILQMPGGVPVATVALDGAKNAAILACQILSAGDEDLGHKMETYKLQLKEKVAKMNEELSKS
ncbi:MAG: 5-(carboxyamino)imidazole ribonucleotide mutase [Vicingaceae bacterium]